MDANAGGELTEEEAEEDEPVAAEAMAVDESGAAHATPMNRMIPAAGAEGLDDASACAGVEGGWPTAAAAFAHAEAAAAAQAAEAAQAGESTALTPLDPEAEGAGGAAFLSPPPPALLGSGGAYSGPRSYVPVRLRTAVFSPCRAPSDPRPFAVAPSYPPLVALLTTGVRVSLVDV